MPGVAYDTADVLVDVISIGIGLGVGYFSGRVLATTANEILTWSLPEFAWPAFAWPELPTINVGGGWPNVLDLDFSDSDGSAPGWSQGITIP